MDNDKDPDEATFLDHLYEYLKNEQFSDIDLMKLSEFIQEEEYDTEAIETDTGVGNISSSQVNNEFAKHFDRFLNNVKKSAIAFSAGVRFYYWDYYKSTKQTVDEQQQDYNVNDHGGYEIT
eukprot:363495_1